MSHNYTLLILANFLMMLANFYFIVVVKNFYLAVVSLTMAMNGQSNMVNHIMEWNEKNKKEIEKEKNEKINS